MAEKVNTGGTVEFKHRDEGLKASKEERKEISDAYARADERKRRKRRKRNLIIILIVAIILSGLLALALS